MKKELCKANKIHRAIVSISSLSVSVPLNSLSGKLADDYSELNGDHKLREFKRKNFHIVDRGVSRPLT
jgi:hypothetical protein